MRRREFIAGLGSAAAWPVVARAQQAAVPVIGFLGSESADPTADRLRGFRQALGETGHVQGRNVQQRIECAASLRCQCQPSTGRARAASMSRAQATRGYFWKRSGFNEAAASMPRKASAQVLYPFLMFLLQ